MEIDPPALAKHFSSLSDSELLLRCSDGYLTDAALTIACTELASRGLSMPSRAGEPPVDPPYEGDFETVAQLLDPIEAQLIAGGLEASGIPTVIADNHLVQMHSLLTIAVGGVRIRVAAARADEARAIIAAIQRGELALSDDDESYLV